MTTVIRTSTSHAAILLGVSRAAVRNMIERGDLVGGYEKDFVTPSGHKRWWVSLRSVQALARKRRTLR